ncbi:protein FAM47E [Pelodytes ibericus]
MKQRATQVYTGCCDLLAVCGFKQASTPTTPRRSASHILAEDSGRNSHHSSSLFNCEFEWQLFIADQNDCELARNLLRHKDVFLVAKEGSVAMETACKYTTREARYSVLISVAVAMSVLTGWDKGSHPRHPWYKERLHNKFLKDSADKLKLSGALNSRRWLFLSKGVDDFRDGYPSSSDFAFNQPSKAASPVVHNSVSDSAGRKPRKRFTKDQVCFSKALPLQQARREYIAQIEYGLTQHPLALYPHLEEGVPPEWFEEIVDILDPEMRLKSASGSYKPEYEELEEEYSTPKEQQDALSVKSRDASSRQSAISEQSRQKNPYTWLTKKEESVKEKKNLRTKRRSTPALDGRVKQATKDFCDLVDYLGGEQCNVNESTIFDLFGSGYDAKSALSVPIHVVELNNVPAQLKMSVGFSPQPRPSKEFPSSYHKQQNQSQENTYCPSWVKSRYGAWYLDPKTWKKQKANEPLKDPEAEEWEQGIDAEKKLSKKDQDCLQLYGTVAFNEYIENKGYRKPEFLKDLPKTDAGELEDVVAREAGDAPSIITLYRSASLSAHEDSIIN